MNYYDKLPNALLTVIVDVGCRQKPSFVTKNLLRKSLSALMVFALFSIFSFSANASTTINVSTGTNAGVAIAAGGNNPEWVIVGTPNKIPKVCSPLSVWENTPVATTNAGWINETGLNSKTSSGLFTYERTFTIPASTASFTYNLKAACDDALNTLELVPPSASPILLTVVGTTTYHLSNNITNTITNPAAGVWTIRAKVNFVDNMAGFLLSGTIDLVDKCSYIQDGSFSNVSVSGSNITNASMPWQIGIQSPQWGGTNDCDGAGGYAQMWGNNTVGESVIQALGSGGIIKGERYDLSLCAKLMATQNSLNPNHVRIRVIAYNGTAPHRAALPTANATLLYETPTITSTTWQNYSSCSWIADKNYTNIEVLPVNNSILNNGNYVSWGLVDNMQLCKVDACDGLGLRIYPDQNSGDKCCFNVDAILQNCISNLKGVRITTPAGVTIASASAPTSWTQSGLTTNTVFWSSPANNSGTSTGGKLCVNAPNSNPFYVIMEWIDNNDSVFCRSERKLTCPPPCMEIEQIKEIKCSGYDANGYPIYNYCLNVINNGTPQSVSITSTSGVFTPITATLASGVNTICGVFTANTPTPPASITITLSIPGTNCTDAIDLKLPNDCPPKECLKIDEVKIDCYATNQNGGSTYQYSWVINNLTGVLPNTVTVTSNGGIEAVYTNVPLNVATLETGLIQYATPVNGQICLKFTVKNANGVIICVEKICFKPPVCEDCCSNFDKGIRVNSVTRTGVNYNGDNVSMNITFAPNRPIKTMSATIVGANRRQVSPIVGNWGRIFGDFGGAVAIPTPNGPGLRYYGGIAPSTSFVNPTLTTRETKWGTNYSGTTGPFNTTIGLIFPAPLSGPSYHPTVDELDYYLRISMTDVKCITCDTLIHITLKRKSSPWKTETWGDPHENLNGKHLKGSQVQGTAEQASSTIQLKMNSEDKGILTIISPEDTQTPSDEKITVIGVGFFPEETIDLEDFSPISASFKKEANDEYMYCAGKLLGGQSASFDVKFTNPLFDKWDNTVVIKYRVGNDDNIMTDYVSVVASKPVVQTGGDEFIELSNTSIKARTYALSFTNGNKSKRPIASVELRMPDGVKLLAYGSGLPDTVQLGSKATYNNESAKSGSYLIPIENFDNQNIKYKDPLNPGETVKPIYITISGGESIIDIGFTSKDEDGTVLSEGVIKPLVPLSVTPNDGATTGADMMLDVYPNPANNSTTVNLGLQKSEMVGIMVTDMQGKEIVTIVEEKLLQYGENIFVLNTNYLTSGTYNVTARTHSGLIVTTKLQIVK